MRSNVYDGLPSTISKLKNKLAEKSNVIQKADVNDRSTWQPVLDASEDVRELCTAINNHFVALKSDFDGKRINLAQYKHNLQQIKDLLTGVDRKIDVPELQGDIIATELKKVL